MFLQTKSLSAHYCQIKFFEQTVGHDLEEAGGFNGSDDVKREKERILSQLAGSQESRDAVIIKDIHKVYPQYMGNPAKVAVRTLTMGVSHGECFGMLGPNGAGKTTTINMLGV